MLHVRPAGLGILHRGEEGGGPQGCCTFDQQNPSAPMPQPPDMWTHKVTHKVTHPGHPRAQVLNPEK